MKWKNVYIFVSSTFNDMHAERDYLTKRVFPELASWCEQRKLRLYDVDLRWGISEEDAAENKRVVDICLSNIDNCRPFFLSFLGQRRGWVPERDDISSDTFEKFPRLKPEIGNRSITELETLHAIEAFTEAYYENRSILEPLFFFRSANYLLSMKGTNAASKSIYTNYHPNKSEDEIAHENHRLDMFKEQMRDKGYACREYAAQWDANASTPELRFLNNETTDYTKGRLAGFSVDGVQLKDVLLAELKRLILAEFGREVETENLNALEKELTEQDLFLSGRTDLYIPNVEFENRFREIIDNRKYGLTLLTAAPGMGKTTFLANFIARFLKQEEDDLGETKVSHASDVHPAILYRFLGVSDASATIQGLIASLYDELLANGLVDPEDLPDNPLHNKRDFLSVLAKAVRDTDLILVLDGLNQLNGNVADNFDFLSATLPDRVTIVASIKTGDSEDDAFIESAYEQGIRIVDYRSFSSSETREEYINDYLENYLKSLDGNQLKALSSLEGSDNPLYLTVVLNELRLYGSFEGLMSKIGQGTFGSSPVHAYDAVLRRLEEDPAYCPIPPDQAVSIIFGHLALARRGLSPKYFELIFQDVYAREYSKEQIADTLFHYLNQVRASVVLRGGRYTFLYDSLRLACLSRYAGSRVQNNERLAKILLNRCDPTGNETWAGQDEFAFSELLYHLKPVDFIRARGLLSNFTFLNAKLRQSGIRELREGFTLFSSDEYEELRALETALAFSNAVLDRYPDQLVEQLWLRLGTVDDPRIRAVLDDAAKSRTRPWFKAIKATAYDITQGRSHSTDWAEGSYELMEVDGDELFIKSSSAVYVVDGDTLAIKQLISCDYDTGLEVTTNYKSLSEIPSDAKTNRFWGITKVKRHLVFYQCSTDIYGRILPEHALSVYGLDGKRWLKDFSVETSDFDLFHRKVRKKHPEVLQLSSWNLDHIYIDGEMLYALFTAGSGLYLIREYDLNSGSGRALGAFDFDDEIGDFLCNGTLVYVHLKNKRRRVLFDIQKTKRVREIEEWYLQEDQVTYFDNKFFINNQIFDGEYGIPIGHWENLRFYFLDANEEYLMGAAVERNLKKEGVDLRYEQLARENAAIIFFWKRGDNQMRMMPRVAHLKSRWKNLAGGYGVLELRDKDRVGLFDIGKLFAVDLSAPNAQLTPHFGAGFVLDMSDSYESSVFNYAIDAKNKRMLLMEGTTLGTVEGIADVPFEGTVYASLDRLVPKNTEMNYRLWLSRMQNTRGREIPNFKHGLVNYFMTGDKLLMFHVDTQEVEAFDLPDQLVIDMPEGTQLEVWEQVLARASDKQKDEKIAQIRQAQKTKMVGVSRSDLMLVVDNSSPYQEDRVGISRYDVSGKAMSDLLYLGQEGVKRFLANQGIVMPEVRFRVESEGQELILKHKNLGEEQAGKTDHAYDGAGEITRVTLHDGGYPSVYAEGPTSPHYVMVSENLIFLIQEPNVETT